MFDRRQLPAPAANAGLTAWSPSFLANGLIIDNPSSAWLLVSPGNYYVPPYTFGWRRPLPGVGSITILYVAPPNGLQPLYGGAAAQATADEASEVADNGFTTESGVIPGTFLLSGTGHTAIAATGTSVALRTSTRIKQVVIKADSQNATVIYVGTATVTNSNNAATGGFQMNPGDVHGFPETDLANIFINGNAGDGVSYEWFT